MLLAVLQILAAYVIADALSGVYHFVTDRGMNFREQVEMFQEHHDTNTMQGFDWQTFALGMPISVCGAWFHSAFWIALGIFLALTQVTHYYAHRRSSSRVIHRLVRTLQKCRIIVSPESHASHHRPPHGRDFCLLSGWNNCWLNFLIRVVA